MATLKDMLARLFGQKTAQPASVFVTMDERNTPVDMRIGELTGDAYHKYIGDTVRQFDKRGYIPNWTVLRTDFPDKNEIPVRKGEIIEWYFHKMIPAIHKAGATTSSAISLRDATYILKSGLGLFTQKTSPGELQKDKRYKEFVQQNEVAKWNVEQSSLKRNNRLYAVSTEEGVLLFSGSEKGIKARGSYLQYLADGFFKLNKVPETMKLYEISIPTQEMTHLADNCIDRFSKSDLKEGSRQLRHSEVSFAAEKFSDHSILEGAVCVDKFDLRPDYNNFDRLTGEFQLGISPRNYDIASLLYISGNGYASHLASDYFHPFSYQYEFGELAEKLADSMKAREEAPLSAHDFGYGALQKEAKEMAKDILQSEFHIHNGEFHLGAKRAAILKEETPKPELMIPKVKRPPRVKQEQGKRNTTGEQALKGNTTRKQAIHVPSVSVTKEKKQLII